MENTDLKNKVTEWLNNNKPFAEGVALLATVRPAMSRIFVNREKTYAKKLEYELRKVSGLITFKPIVRPSKDITGLEAVASGQPVNDNKSIQPQKSNNTDGSKKTKSSSKNGKKGTKNVEKGAKNSKNESKIDKKEQKANKAESKKGSKSEAAADGNAIQKKSSVDQVGSTDAGNPNPTPDTELRESGNGNAGQDSAVGSENSTQRTDTPDFIQRIVKEHAHLVKLRSQLGDEREAIPQANNPNNNKKRKVISESIAQISDRIEILFQAKEDYYTKGTTPDMNLLFPETLEVVSNPKEPKTKKAKESKKATSAKQIKVHNPPKKPGDKPVA